MDIRRRPNVKVFMRTDGVVDHVILDFRIIAILIRRHIVGDVGLFRPLVDLWSLFLHWSAFRVGSTREPVVDLKVLK